MGNPLVLSNSTGSAAWCAHLLSRPVGRYEQRSDYPRLVERLRELCGTSLRAARIAALLNAEGFRPPRWARQFTAHIVLDLLARLGLPRCKRYGSPAGLGADEFRPAGLARRLGVSRDRVRRWLCSDYLNVRRGEEGHAVVCAHADELRRLRELGRLFEAKVSGPRPDKLKRPKRRPGWQLEGAEGYGIP